MKYTLDEIQMFCIGKSVILNANVNSWNLQAKDRKGIITFDKKRHVMAGRFDIMMTEPYPMGEKILFISVDEIADIHDYKRPELLEMILD